MFPPGTALAAGRPGSSPKRCSKYVSSASASQLPQTHTPPHCRMQDVLPMVAYAEGKQAEAVAAAQAGASQGASNGASGKGSQGASNGASGGDGGSK